MAQDSLAGDGPEVSDPRRGSQTSADTGTRTASPDDPEARRRRELALFLKARRAAISAESVGLRPSGRRRARGLLREEVAQRAGISPTWYTWLEQGRDIRPSDEVLEHLADALLLDEGERRHLLTLGKAGGAPHRGFSQGVPATLLAWLNGLDQPAYVLNGRADLLVWNNSALEIFGDFAALAPGDRNILRMIFLWPHWRQLFTEWERLAASSVAQFRGETARHAGAPELAALIDGLIADSPEFAALWHARRVDLPRMVVKRIRHHRHGPMQLTYAPLRPQGLTGDLSVVVYSPLLLPA